MKVQSIEFGRVSGETDEEWAAVCKDMARCLAKAWDMEHLLPAQAIEARSDATPKSDAAEGESAAPKGCAQ